MAKNDHLKTALSDLMGTGQQSPQSEPQTARDRNKTDYSQLPDKTVTVAFRVPKEEKARLQKFMQKEFGLSLAAGLKKIVYDYVNRREQ